MWWSGLANPGYQHDLPEVTRGSRGRGVGPNLAENHPESFRNTMPWFYPQKVGLSEEETSTWIFFFKSPDESNR